MQSAAAFPLSISYACIKKLEVNTNRVKYQFVRDKLNEYTIDENI